MKIIVASHRRSGTHLLIDTIINNFDIYKNYENLDNFNGRQNIASNNLFKTHSHANMEIFFNTKSNNNFLFDIIEQSKIIYVYRDGRDVLTSLYFYMQGLKKNIKSMSFNEFILMKNNFDDDTYQGDMNRIEYWHFHVSNWISKENILLLSFENIINNFSDAISNISNFLEIKPKNQLMNMARKKHSNLKSNMLNKKLDALFKKFNNKIRDVKYSSTFFRKGKIGDYQSIFNENTIKLFNSYSYDLMKHLNYY